jgi:DNA-binding transcriptional LysR family regulator
MALNSDDLAFLQLLAREQTLAATARALGVSPSAVTQKLHTLEQGFGCQLVRRSGRSTQLTGDGQWLVEHSRSVLADLDHLHERFAQRKSDVSGPLRVAASLGFGRKYVAPLLARFAQQHPGIQVELTLTDRADQLKREHWDVIVHIGSVIDGDLVAHALAPNRRLLCASPAWLAQHGQPLYPQQLSSLPCIALRENAEDVSLWKFHHMAGKGRARNTNSSPPEAVRIKPVMASNDGEAVKTWGLQGLGAMVRSEWDVASELAAGQLVQLLPAWDLPEAPVHALTNNRREMSARTQLFLRALQETLSPPPWRVSRAA